MSAGESAEAPGGRSLVRSLADLFHRSDSASTAPLPWWGDAIVLPLINLALSFIVAGLVVWLVVGANPLSVGLTMIDGAFGSADGLGSTLYYATTYIFAGLAVAVAYQAGLFNIGAEGQGQVAGVGIAMACLGLGGVPAILAIPLAILAGMVFGAAWAFIPGYLQAKRGSHVVITTIMFNYIAASLVQYLLVNKFMQPGSGEPKSALFADSTQIPSLSNALAAIGIDIDFTLVNLSFPLALLAALAVWALLWRTRLGYAIRTVGHNPSAAVYGGMSPARIIIVTMLISGALSGLMGVNILMGDQHRLIIDYTAGAGFIGIAVSLMGRSRPIGIVLASILFGALIVGSESLVFDNPVFDKNMVVMIQGIIILFVGAFELMLRPQLSRLLALFAGSQPGA